MFHVSHENLRQWQLPPRAITKHAHYKTPHCKCNSSQFKMAEMDPPPCPVSPLLDFTDPDVRLQSLGPGLPSDPSFPRENKPPVSSCHRLKNVKTFPQGQYSSVLLSVCIIAHLGRRRCIAFPSSSSCCDDSLRSAQQAKRYCSSQTCSQGHMAQNGADTCLVDGALVFSSQTKQKS